MKKIIVIVFFFISLQVVAMNENKLVCYLEKMPLKVQNHIVSYLMESNKDFIKRTRARGDFSADPYDAYVTLGGLTSNVIGCCSSDKTKVALLPVFNGYGVNGKRYRCILEPTLTVLDVQENKSPQIIYDKEVSSEEYKHIALSPFAALAAIIHYDETVLSKYCCHARYVVEIRKILKKITQDNIHETKWLKKTFSFVPVSIDFNKQGTHLIVHGETTLKKRKYYSIKSNGTEVKKTKYSLDSDYCILPLKQVETKEGICFSSGEEVIVCLNSYFRQKGVCKSIANGDRDKI